VGAKSKARAVCLALNVEEACAALGVSWDFWAEHIAPEVRVVRRGRRKLVAVSELERWLDRNAEATTAATARRATAAAAPASARRDRRLATTGVRTAGSAGVRTTPASGASDG
jgi:hypothetical protein